MCKGGRQSRFAEKAVKRRRVGGGMLKTVGTAAPGQQCTQCGTQVLLLCAWHVQWRLVGQSLCCCGMHVLPCNDPETFVMCSAQLLMLVFVCCR